MSWCYVVNEVLVSTVSISLSPLANIILAMLIVLRLIYRRRHFRNVLGEECRYPYINIMSICVESSAPIVIFVGIYTAKAFE